VTANPHIKPSQTPTGPAPAASPRSAFAVFAKAVSSPAPPTKPITAGYTNLLIPGQEIMVCSQCVPRRTCSRRGVDLISDGVTRDELLAVSAAVPVWPEAARALRIGRTKQHVQWEEAG
jgi:hypothetical protein